MRYFEIIYERARLSDDPAFRAWFGASKVVDAEGNPLRVYHGTKSDITDFRPEALGRSTKAKSAQAAYFFTDKPHVADTYADMAPSIENQDEQKAIENRQKELEAENDILFDQSIEKQEAHTAGKMEEDVFLEWWEGYVKRSREIYKEIERNRYRAIELRRNERSEGGNVLPVYLKMENPLVKDYSGLTYRDETFIDVIEKAKQTGHDGVIFLNVYDAWKWYGGDHYRSNIYAVFKPTQIKSAIGNKGTFNPEDSRITENS